LPFNGKNRLELAVAPLLGRSACRFALDQIQFAAFRVALGTVGQLARQSAPSQSALAGDVARLARRFAGPCGVDRLGDDLLRDRRILLQKRAQPLIHKRLHDAGNIRVQLALGLTLELRLRQLHAHHRHQALAHIVA
jgi:hypothetical protein